MKAQTRVASPDGKRSRKALLGTRRRVQYKQLLFIVSYSGYGMSGAVGARMRFASGRCRVCLPATTAGVIAVVMMVLSPQATADNDRLNDSVAANVYTIQQQAGCPTKLRVNPQLRLAAQWHAGDLLRNRALDADIGSDGSSPQDRATAAGYRGAAAETVAINPALAISGIEIMNRWYYNSGYMAIMSNCAHTEIGVWSENNLDRTVVVAVYGSPA